MKMGGMAVKVWSGAQCNCKFLDHDCGSTGLWSGHRTRCVACFSTTGLLEAALCSESKSGRDFVAVPGVGGQQGSRNSYVMFRGGGQFAQRDDSDPCARPCGGGTHGTHFVWCNAQSSRAFETVWRPVLG